MTLLKVGGIFVIALFFLSLNSISTQGLPVPAIPSPANPIFAHVNTPPIGPVIFYANSLGDIIGFRCRDSECKSIRPIAPVYSFTDATDSISTSLPADNLPVVVYRTDATGADNVVLTKCIDPMCTVFQSSTVYVYGSSDDFYGETRVVVPADNRPVILFAAYDGSGKDVLKIIKCGDSYCSSSNIETNLVQWPNPLHEEYDLAVGSDGLPVAVYRSGLSPTSVTIMKCDNSDCTQFHTNAITGVGMNATQPSIAISQDGYPILAYTTGNNVINVAKCTAIDCAGPISISQHGSNARDLTIRITPDGVPLITFYKNNVPSTPLSELYALKCGSSDCMSGIDQLHVMEQPVGNNGVSRVNTTLSGGVVPITIYHLTTGSFPNTTYEIKLAVCADFACATSNKKILRSSTLGTEVGEDLKISG